MSAAPRLVASVPDAVAALRLGDRRMLARMLSALEDGHAVGSQLMAQIRQTGVGCAQVLALTGPPGVGKSTLVAALARIASEGGKHVAILAVDPSSPVTGGAVLGDRVRMVNEVADGVYIRSFANRGLAGGLARVIPDAVDVVAAAGYDTVFIETVGVGQSEIEVARYADVTIVVLSPYLGDEVQAAKAGLMEIADAFAINKCDLPGAARAVRDVRSSTRMRHVGRHDVPVMKVAATTGEHVAEVWRQIETLLADAVARPGTYAERAEAARLDELAAATTQNLRRAKADGSIESGSIVGRVLAGELTTSEAVIEVERLLTSELA